MKFITGKDRNQTEFFCLEQARYVCPAGETLLTNGRWYFINHGKTTNRMKHYKTNRCPACAFFAFCTKNKAGRLIERTEHAEVIEENRQRVELNKDLYRRRQAIVKHPYGIIKRQWDFNYIMTKKTIKHASADVGLIFTAFNLRRIFNILDQNLLKKYLKVLASFFRSITACFKVLYAVAILFIYHCAGIFCSSFHARKSLIFDPEQFV